MWLFILSAAGWYLAEALTYAASTELQAGSTLWNRGIWYFAHVAMATPIFLIAPLQFLAAIRRAAPAVHRWLGRAYLTGSILGAAMAAYLGATIVYTGSRLPLTLFAIVWFAFSCACWISARNKDFLNHRRFAIRSFSVGLGFVWVRLISDFTEPLLGFMPIEDVRETSKEWLTFVVPLLLVEAWLTWIPALKLRPGARLTPGIGKPI